MLTIIYSVKGQIYLEEARINVSHLPISHHQPLQQTFAAKVILGVS